MDRTDQNIKIHLLIDKYFSQKEEILTLKPGEFLIKEDKYNDRLFLVLEGFFTGTVKNIDGSELEVYQATKGMFSGVNSFFSKSFISSSTVKALRESKVTFLTWKSLLESGYSHKEIYEDFMSVIVSELMFRQQTAQAIYVEKEAALKKLVETEKYVSLGQMAASIAHELNNSISILKRNSDWLAREVFSHLADEADLKIKFFNIGLQFGRKHSSREVRKRTAYIQEKLGADKATARKLAYSNLELEHFEEMVNFPDHELARLSYYWEVGATIHDMQIAADHSIHVVKSVKQLGAQKKQNLVQLDIIESINEALMLLDAPLSGINIYLEYNDTPTIAANKGELVQVWLNLVKNAAESLKTSKTEDPEIKIITDFQNNFLIIKIIDNGPGINQDVLPKIFQPNFTTKIDGLSFGLGLGLPIVQRIIQSYNGEINVTSKPGETIFETKILIGA